MNCPGFTEGEVNKFKEFEAAFEHFESVYGTIPELGIREYGDASEFYLCEDTEYLDKAGVLLQEIEGEGSIEWWEERYTEWHEWMTDKR